MDIFSYQLNYDAWANSGLLTLCAALPQEQWLHPFDFGQGSIYGTFDHLIDSMEYWTSLMQEQQKQPGPPNPFIPTLPDPERRSSSIQRRFEAISPAFIVIARKLRDENRLGDTFIDLETGPARRSYGACITHVTTHNMHHRAQIRVMLDLLGVDYDPFNGFAMDVHPLEPVEQMEPAEITPTD